MSTFWIMRMDANTYDLCNRLMARRKLKVSNYSAVFDATKSYYRSIMDDAASRFPLPSNVPTPQLQMPSDGFAPDFFWCQEFFVSRRLREAVALPADAVQYLPVELVSASAEAEKQDYRWMNLLAFETIVDWQQSVYTTYEGTSAKTGNPYRRLQYVSKFVVRQDAQPMIELFCLFERTTAWIAADPLAERVLRAGCTGVSFHELETSVNFRNQRIKTLDGVGLHQDKPIGIRPKRRKSKPAAFTSTPGLTGDLAHLEALLQHRLPKALVDFVADPPAALKEIPTWYAAVSDPALLLRMNQEVRAPGSGPWTRDGGAWPAPYLVIGRDGYGSAYLIDVGEGDNPPVLFHDSKLGDFDEEAPSIAVHVEQVLAEAAEAEAADREDAEAKEKATREG